MEIIEYYLNLTDQFFIIEKLDFKDEGAVKILHNTIEEIVLTMKIIVEVYPEFDAIWGSANLSKELSYLQAKQDDEIIEPLFLDIKKKAMACSTAVIPRFKFREGL